MKRSSSGRRSVTVRVFSRDIVFDVNNLVPRDDFEAP